MKIIIIGAGPTGLGAAYRCEQLGVDWMLCEARSDPGGLSRSTQTPDGYTWDWGCHVLFSRYPEFRTMIDGLDLELITHDRRAFAWMRGQRIPYPVQHHAAKLGSNYVEDLRLAQERIATSPPPRNFSEWLLGQFGESLTRGFFRPYNLKVWQWSLDHMSAQWVSERIALPSKATADAGKPWGGNATFRYPRSGGIGAVWKKLADSLPRHRIRYNSRFAAMPHLSGEKLISTIPLTELASWTNDDRLINMARYLHHSSVNVLGLGIAGDLHSENASWAYFPEAHHEMYRASMPSNYSLDYCRPSVLIEMSDQIYSAKQSLKELRMSGLTRRVLSEISWQQRIEHAYPIPTLRRDEALDVILPALEAQGIYSRGRFGAWKYEIGNMDHCWMQGYQCVDHIVNGTREVVLRGNKKEDET